MNHFYLYFTPSLSNLFNFHCLGFALNFELVCLRCLNYCYIIGMLSPLIFLAEFLLLIGQGSSLLVVIRRQIVNFFLVRIVTVFYLLLIGFIAALLGLVPNLNCLVLFLSSKYYFVAANSFDL